MTIPSTWWVRQLADRILIRLTKNTSRKASNIFSVIAQENRHGPDPKPRRTLDRMTLQVFKTIGHQPDRLSAGPSALVLYLILSATNLSTPSTIYSCCAHLIKCLTNGLAARRMCCAHVICHTRYRILLSVHWTTVLWTQHENNRDGCKESFKRASTKVSANIKKRPWNRLETNRKADTAERTYHPQHTTPIALDISCNTTSFPFFFFHQWKKSLRSSLKMHFTTRFRTTSDFLVNNSSSTGDRETPEVRTVHSARLVTVWSSHRMTRQQHTRCTSDHSWCPTTYARVLNCFKRF